MVDQAKATTRLKDYFAPLGSRGYRWLFAAEAVSEFGNGFHLVALPFMVGRIDPRASVLGLVVAAYGIFRLIGTPLGGVWSDRAGAWKAMMISDVARAILTLGLAIGAVATNDIVVVAVLAAGLGFFGGLFHPAALSITPTLLPENQLQAGLALSSTATFAAGLAAPGIAGVVVLALDPAFALGLDAVTFAVSAGCLAMIGALRTQEASTGNAKDGRSGFLAFLRESKLLRAVLLITAAANVTIGGMTRVALPEIAESEFAAGVLGLGGLLVAFTAGSFGGGLVAAGLTTVRRRGATAMGFGLVMAVAVSLVPFFGLAGALALMFIAGAASTITNVIVMTLIQLDTPAPMLGRVMGAVIFCALGLFPVSVAATGYLVDRFGSATMFVASGVLLFAAFLFGLSRKEITTR